VGGKVESFLEKWDHCKEHVDKEAQLFLHDFPIGKARKIFILQVSKPGYKRIITSSFGSYTNHAHENILPGNLGGRIDSRFSIVAITSFSYHNFQ
jgi:hypothetical protein